MQTSTPVPDSRVLVLGDGPIDAKGQYVLYWMVAARRTRWNFGLQRAIEIASELSKPLLVFEGVRCGVRWITARTHRFVLDGMRDNRDALAASPVGYHPYVEPAKGDGKGLLEALMAHACAVVTDDFPAWFLPRMIRAAAAKAPVRFEAIDGNGLYPMRLAERVFTTAYSFRRHLHKTLPPHLLDWPTADPIKAASLPPMPPLPPEITDRWPAASTDLLQGDPDTLAVIPVDHSVPPVSLRGGALAARAVWTSFLDGKLGGYGADRNHPDRDGASGLSPYLHFGHFSPHEAFADIVQSEGWTPERLAEKPTGQRAGWWGMGEAAESFLDELITWREIGYNMCALDPKGYDTYGSLPQWARTTLEAHEDDERPWIYDLETLERAETHDEIWNAAQRQLVREGKMHNYLRMLWGKKVLEWSATPQDALDVLTELNNKYALDGRNPNSYSGIYWCLGRYDRAWGPERSIFGKIRFMSSDSTRRKLKMKAYLKRYGALEDA